MSIDHVFTAFKTKQQQYELMVPLSWTQGRTLYGGLSAALAYQAAENLIEDERYVRAFHCNFIGPIDAEQPVIVEAELLRTGKNVSQIVAKVSQHGQVATMVQVCFGVNRDSKLHHINQSRHSLKPPKSPKFIPQIPKLVPKFIQHFDYVFEKGNLAFTKNEDAIIHGWSKFSKAPSSMNIAYLIALMDAWPPTMFQLLRLPAPASTMSWDIEFINPQAIVEPNSWLASETTAHHIQNGYGHEEAKFWNEQGQLIAIAKQVVAIFA